ncbi:MAG TPA: hypothetical protein VM242_06180 [Acidimicrobiales bacterium]|nr:hypothetical protein [Acidimicrobiales bacterium]
MRPIVGRLAAALMIASTPVATWWLVGDLSEGGDVDDFIVKAPELTTAQEALIGGVAMAALMAAAGVLAALVRRHRITRSTLRPVLPLLGGGAFIGFTARVVTARVGGANIGGSLLLVAAPGVVVAMLLWSWGLAPADLPISGGPGGAGHLPEEDRQSDDLRER